MIVLFCRWKYCQYRYESDQPTIPATCPRCKRTGHWASDPPPLAAAALSQAVADVTGAPDAEKYAYILTLNDVRLLKGLRIDPEVPPLLREG